MTTVPGSPYDVLSYRDLQAECKKRGLKALAKRDQLSKSLEEWDKSPANTPQKGRPKPAIAASTLRTGAMAYPPPTPPYSDEDDASDSASEPPSPHQPSSPANTPKRAYVDSVPSPLARYPVPSSPYVPTDHPTEKVAGWMWQLGFFAVVLVFYLMVASSGNDLDSPIRDHRAIDTLRHELSSHRGGEKIAQTLATNHHRITLIGPIKEGREIAKKIATHLAPDNPPLYLKESNVDLLAEKIAKQLSTQPRSVVVINTDVIDRKSSHFLNMLTDDTFPKLMNHDKVDIHRALFILLADLAEGKAGDEITHEFVEQAFRNRWDDRVAQRVYPYVVL